MKNMLLVLGLIFIPSTAFALIGFGIQAGSDLSKLGPETYVDNSGEIPVVFNSYEMKNSPVGGGAYAFVDLFGFALEGDFDFAVGEYEFDFGSKEFELALGYLHGLTDASANHALIWNIEFEFN